MSKDRVTRPTYLAHVVLRTAKSKYPEMVKYYETFLGADISYENDFMTLMTYDEEHHRLALLTFPDTGPKVKGSSGLEHFAFGFSSIHDLLKAYNERKAHGIMPFWCVNHGPTTSIYYKDPDGNQIETQVENMDVEGIKAFMESGRYETNAIGTDFDPEDYMKRLAAGEDEEKLKERVEIGPRGPPDFS